MEKDIRCDSYIRKDELIKMIDGLHFDYVKNMHIDCITGFLIQTDPENPREQDVTPLYYSIDI